MASCEPCTELPRLRVTGLPDSLRRSTTAAAFVVAVVVSVLPVPVRAANNDLRNGSVTPQSGTTAALFTFQVDYVGAAAISVSVRLSGSASGISTIPLALVGGSETDGTYAVTTTLAADTYTVSFRGDASTQNDPVENIGTLVVSPQPTPTPVPTPVPTARPTPRPTPRPTARPTPRPTAAPTLPPGATPRPPVATPQPGATPGTPGTPAAPAASGSLAPSATEGTLAGNPTPSSTEGGGNVPASSSTDPNAQEASDTESSAGVGRVVMLAVGGALAVSGAGYLAVLAVRRRGRVNGGSG